jgi:hypothetical protein
VPVEPIDLDTTPEKLTNDKLLDYYTDVICNYIIANKNIVLRFVESLNKNFKKHIETKMNMEEFSKLIKPFSTKFTNKLKESIFTKNDVDIINMFDYENKYFFIKRYDINEDLLKELEKIEKDEKKKQEKDELIKTIMEQINKKQIEYDKIRTEFIKNILNDIGGIHNLPVVKNQTCDTNTNNNDDDDIANQLKKFIAQYENKTGGTKKSNKPSNKTKMIRTIKNHHKTMKKQLKTYITKHI